MADKTKNDVERVIFSKDSTASDMAKTIRQKQDEWAKANPKESHTLYPDVYDENGERIKK
jgi:hypothetical protein